MNLKLIEESPMVGRIIGLVSCLMCAVPFLIISVYNKDSKEPINFWSGDITLSMVSLYLGAAIICFDCTLGIYLTYRNYKRVLDMYS